MIPWWWSWALTAVGVFGLWQAGSGKWWGWGIGLASQAAWLTYAVTTEQWGFIPAAFVYGTMYARNMRRARKAVRA